LIESVIDGRVRVANIEDGLNADEELELYEQIRIEFEAAGWQVSKSKLSRGKQHDKAESFSRWLDEESLVKLSHSL
jgi:hypothetical protein